MEMTQSASKLEKEKILVQKLWKYSDGVLFLQKKWKTKMSKNIKTIVNTILSKVFPVESFGRSSVFLQQTWLEKNTQTLFVKDIMWIKR